MIRATVRVMTPKYKQSVSLTFLQLQPSTFFSRLSNASGRRRRISVIVLVRIPLGPLLALVFWHPMHPHSLMHTYTQTQMIEYEDKAIYTKNSKIERKILPFHCENSRSTIYDEGRVDKESLSMKTVQQTTAYKRHTHLRHLEFLHPHIILAPSSGIL